MGQGYICIIVIMRDLMQADFGGHTSGRLYYLEWGLKCRMHIIILHGVYLLMFVFHCFQGLYAFTTDNLERAAVQFHASLQVCMMCMVVWCGVVW